MTDGTKIVDMPDRETVRREAGNWLARRETRPLSQAEATEFAAWLKQSPRHAEEFERLSGVWDDLDILDELNYLDSASESEPRAPVRLWERRQVVSALAASLVVLVGGAVIYQTAFEGVPLQDEAFATDFGEQKTIALVDGSSLILNTDSEVEVVYSRQARDVRLVRGEAHFEVLEDTKRPFSVYAGEGIVRAVGTAFTVRFREETQFVEVTVSEGRVELIPQASADGNTAAASSEAPSREPLVEMTAGDNAVFKQEVLKHITELPRAELNRKLSWRRGLLAFAGEPLGEVLNEVARYTDVDFRIEDPAIEALPIGGYFKVGEVDGLLRALEETFEIGVERIDDGRVRLYQKT